MKRLFIALPIPESTTSEIETFLQPYKDHPKLKAAKWVEAKHMHVTALFLGEVSDPLLPEIIELTRGVCGRMQHFELIPTGVSCFPGKNRAKMVWYRYQNSLAFEEFVNELKKYLTPAVPALAEEEKDPIPHVTLARLKETIDPKVISFQGKPWPQLVVNEAILFESVMSPEGSEYKILERFPYGF